MKKNKGFTLIELLIVIVIIGILASILAPRLIRARYRALYTGCIYNMRTIGISLEIYSANDPNKQYPSPSGLAGAVLFAQLRGYGVTERMMYCPSNNRDYFYQLFNNLSPTRYFRIYCNGIHNTTLGINNPTYQSGKGFY